jgi:hypothetical protein
VELAQTVGARTACRLLGASRATVNRHRSELTSRASVVQRQKSYRRFADLERQAILDAAHSERFLDQSVREIYATVLDTIGTLRRSRPVQCRWAEIERDDELAPAASSESRTNLSGREKSRARSSSQPVSVKRLYDIGPGNVVWKRGNRRTRVLWPALWRISAVRNVSMILRPPEFVNLRRDFGSVDIGSRL